MKAENNTQPATKTPITRDRHAFRSAETKATMVAAWAPQPNPLTREEIRRMVIDQIG